MALSAATCGAEGYATEAAQSCMEYAFFSLGSERVIALVLAGEQKLLPRGGKDWYEV